MRVVFVAALLAVSAGILVAGCGPQKAASPQAVIEHIQSLPTTQAKVDYVIAQAKAFLGSKEFQSAIDLANYVLRNLDSHSQEAQGLLEKAKSGLQEAASKALGEVQKKMGAMGK